MRLTENYVGPGTCFDILHISPLTFQWRYKKLTYHSTNRRKHLQMGFFSTHKQSLGGKLPFTPFCNGNWWFLPSSETFQSMVVKILVTRDPNQG